MHYFIEDGDWTDETLTQLGKDVIQMFYRQYDHAVKQNEMDKHVVIDLLYIARNPAGVIY